MISERISDDIPPQMKILNMVIPILMRFYILVSNWSAASRIEPYKGVRHPTKCDVINDVKLFPTVYRRINCRKFGTLSNQTSRYKSKCIRIHNDMYSKTCVKRPISKDQKLVFKTNYCLMQVKGTAECSKGSILQ